MHPETANYIGTIVGLAFLGQYFFEQVVADAYIATATVQLLMLFNLVFPSLLLFHQYQMEEEASCFPEDLLFSTEHRIACILFAYQVHNIATETVHYIKKRKEEERDRRSGSEARNHRQAAEGKRGEREGVERKKRMRAMQRQYKLNMAHHFAAGTACLICLQIPSLLPDFVFFGGVSEISTLFLVPLDVCWYVLLPLITLFFAIVD